MGKTSELVRKTVVHIAVVRFICADDQHYIAEPGILWKAPIAFCKLGRRHVFGAALIDLSQIVDVSDDRLFLEIANDAVCGLRTDQVKSEEEAVEDPLDPDDDSALGWLISMKVIR